MKSGRTYGESNCHGKVGYHVYNKTWEAADGEALVHVRKIARKRFRSINCGCERGIVIGQLPRKLSRVCSLFLQRGGTIECTVRLVPARKIYVHCEVSTIN